MPKKKPSRKQPDRETDHLIRSMKTLASSFRGCGLVYTAMICDLTAKKLMEKQKK